MGTLRMSRKHFRKDGCLMEQYTRYIGVDVSVDTIVIAEARPGAV